MLDENSDEKSRLQLRVSRLIEAYNTFAAEYLAKQRQKDPDSKDV